MINCNPETVSTDYDTADRLYFQPLTFEDVMAVIETERSAGAEVSCLVQFGGQTPLKLALALQQAGVRILGTSPDSIDLAEDRKRFAALLASLSITQPASGTATSREEARDVAAADRLPGRRPAVVRARRARDGDRLRRRHARSLHDAGRRRLAGASRCSSTSSSRTRSSSTSTPLPTRPAPSSSAASWSTSRRPASTRATAPASCRRSSARSGTSRRFATTRAASRARSRSSA